MADTSSPTENNFDNDFEKLDPLSASTEDPKEAAPTELPAAGVQPLLDLSEPSAPADNAPPQDSAPPPKQEKKASTPGITVMLPLIIVWHRFYLRLEYVSLTLLQRLHPNSFGSLPDIEILSHQVFRPSYVSCKCMLL